MKIFFLEEVLFEGIDPKDGERIEIRLGDSVWANARKLSRARKDISKWLADGWVTEITEFDIPITKRQKYLYILNHEYLDADGTCFHYRFDPQTSYERCRSMQCKLLSNPKYMWNDKRIYKGRNNGWFIEKYEIIF